MNISIAIVDADSKYVSRLSEVLQQYKDLSISIFTNVQRYRDDLEHRQFDILLFDPDISEEDLALSGAKLAICLYSDHCKNIHRYADCIKVLKYQRVSNIYKSMLREYADKAGYSVDFCNGRSTKLLGVYSPVGGAGKTTVALAFASKLKSLGNTVLFVSTEQLESSSSVNTHDEDGMAILINDLSDENINFKVKLTAISKHGMDDLEYLEGFIRLVDYDAVTADEIRSIFEHIKRDSDYQYVVIDMDSNLDTINRTVFELSDQILLVEKPGELPVRKMELFARQVLVQEQKRKIYRLHNFAENNSVYSGELDVPVIGQIHNYGNLKLTHMIHTINANGEYDISQLID